MELIEQLKAKIKGRNIRIVFPEGMDERIVEAARQLKAEGLVEPIVIHTEELEGLTTIIPSTYDKMDELVAQAVELRQGKDSEEKIRGWMQQGNYLGTMMVKAGLADGLVGGATYSTGDTVRPALQLVKTKPGHSVVSSMFIMIKGEEKLVMGDCAINPNPTAEQLAEIAIQTAETSRVFGIEPVVGLLSFSTNGSAKHELVDKVQTAKKILDEKNVGFAYEGEIQFDAAIEPSVGQKKFPGSKAAGHINTFIFPDLQSGNIGYKIAQRLGGYEAIGPVLQGLNAPINDLSRGCSVNDVYCLAIITASQTL